MAVPFVQDPAAAAADDLGGSVLRLVAALYRKSPIRADGRRGRVGIDHLRDLTACDDDAIAAAEASGFLRRESTPAGKEYARIAPAGLAIFLADEVAADPDDLLGTVGRMRSVVVNVEVLALCLGRDDPEATWQALGAIEAAGTVERLPDHPDGPSVALTALGAARLGLRIDEAGTRWLAPGEIDPVERHRKAPAVIDEDDEARRAAYFDRADPRPSGPDLLIESEDHGRAIREYWRQYDDRLKAHPDDEADRARAAAEYRAIKRRHSAERARLVASFDFRRLPRAEREARMGELEARRAAELADLDRRRAVLYAGQVAGLLTLEIDVGRPSPLPRILLGLGVAWPAGRNADGTCRGCGDRPLARLAVCLVCHRSGLDHRMMPPIAAEAPKPPPKAKAPKAEAPADDLPSCPTIPAPAAPEMAGGTGKVNRPARAVDAAWDRTMAELAAMRAGRKGRPVATVAGRT